MENKLEEYGLHIVQSDKEDRLNIDFKILDDHDIFCTEVFGDTQDDVEVVCEHPAIEYDDDETVGECPICGAICSWHYETYGDDGYVAKDRVVDRWEEPDKIGGIIGKYLDELRDNDGTSI